MCNKEDLLKKIQSEKKLPEHVAIILDGNRRWATERKLPKPMGHKAGCETLENIVEECARIGISYLTVYGFSTENWKRSKEEVGALMQLFRLYMKKLVKVANDNNVKVEMLGDKSAFDTDIIKGIDLLVDSTKKNTGMIFSFAVNYGARDEIKRSIKNILYDYKNSDIDNIDDWTEKYLNEEYISSKLDTKNISDPDLLIRTGGDLRISNFLLWQSAYTEFYFTDVLWPDFKRENLIDAIIEFSNRNRRFGGK